jgi:hypothetical protein
MVQYRWAITKGIRMVNWNKDRNRQLAKRARAEEIEEKMKETAARPAHIRPSVGKAALRAMGEELVRQYEDRLGVGGQMPSKCYRRTRRR